MFLLETWIIGNGMWIFFLSVCLRLPTSICGCGSGESGCSACGCCKACARELDGQEARQGGIFDAVKEMIPLDLLLGMTTDVLHDFILPCFALLFIQYFHLFYVTTRIISILLKAKVKISCLYVTFQCQWFALCWILNIWSELLNVLRRDVYRLQFMSFSAMLVCCLCHTLSVASAWTQYLAQLSLLILLFYCRIVQSHCFSITSLHHSLMCVLFCSALLRLPSSSIILSGLPVPGALCVFSCACPSPSRSEHWGAHSDPSGGETSEDQSATQAGGGQRYGAGLNWVCPGNSCFFSACWS